MEEHSGFIDGPNSEAYEDTERSNQRLQIQRNNFINNNYDAEYKYIGDGYDQQEYDRDGR